MFCPNCGTQNDDSAAACQKCAFNLKGATAPKFKGTMLMVNAPPTVPRPVAGPASNSARPPVAQPAPAPTPAPPGVAAPRPIGAGQKPMMKATMIGVAPPSPGGVAPPGGSPAQRPAPPAAPAQDAGAPAAPTAATAPTSPAFAVPPAATATLQAAADRAPLAASGPVTGPAAPGPHHSDVVNPLGGTMVATPGAMGFGAAPPAPTADGPATPAFGATTPAGFAPTDVPAMAQQQPAPAPSAWGAPAAPPHQQPAAGGWGAPAGAAQPVQQPAAGGWGAPQPAGAQQGYSPYGAPPAALVAGGQQAMQPIGPQHAGYAMAAGPGQHGPIGKMRNPVMVVVLTYVTCGIYGMIAFLTMLGELKAFRQKNDISPILFLLPVISILEMIKLPAKVLEAKRMAGVPNAQEPNVILYLFLGIYMLPADLNEIWQVASAKQGYGALPPGAV